MRSILLGVAVAVVASSLIDNRAVAQAVADPSPPAAPAPPPAAPAPAVVVPAPTAAPTPAPAASSPASERSVFTLGARAALTKPQGDVAGIIGSDRVATMAHEFGSPGLQGTIEGGIRFPVGLTLAAFFQGGTNPVEMSAGNGLCQAFQCKNTRTFKYGVELLYHFRRDRDLQPFLGAGLGLERSGYDAVEAGETVTLRYKGTFLEGQLGVDYAITPAFFLGAFVSDSTGKYDTLELKGQGATISGDIAEKRSHGWLQGGLRLRYDIPL